MSATGKPKLIALAIGAGLLAAAGFAAYLNLSGDKAAAPAVSLAEGERLYGESCASCHGASLEGQPKWRERDPEGYLPAPPHDDSGHTWHHPDQQLFAITKKGTAALVGGDYQTKMLAYEDSLSDEEIRGILNYIKSRWPENIRARQAEISERAAQAAQ